MAAAKLMSPFRRNASTGKLGTPIRLGYPSTILGNPRTMEHDETDRVIDETGVGDPLADRDPEQPAKPASDIEPEDATPEEGVERPETDEPNPDHVVEEKQKSD